MTIANDPATRARDALITLTLPAPLSLAAGGTVEKVVELVRDAGVMVDGLEDDALPGVLMAAPLLLARALVTLTVGVAGIYNKDEDEDGTGREDVDAGVELVEVESSPDEVA